MSAITIKDPVSNRNVAVEVVSSTDLIGETYSVVRYTAQTSAEVDCTFAIVESANGIACQKDWQGEIVSVDEIAEHDWVDCTPTDDDDMLDVSETAALLDVSRQRVHQLIQAGQLEGRKIGKTWYVYRHSIERRLRG